MPTTILRTNGQRFTLDVENSFSADPSDNLTAHPIEDGAEVVDHAQARALVVSFSGMVADRGQRGVAFRPDAVGRGRLAVEWLEQIRGEVVTLIHARHGTFERMLLARFPYSSTSREITDFGLTFQQVAVARRETVLLPPLALRAPVDRGQQPTIPAETSQDEADTLSSLAYQARQAVGGG